MPTQRTTTPEVTTSAFVRSHSHQPRGFGAWAFQASTRREAFEADRFGEVRVFTGPFGQAKAEAVASFAGTCSFVAVCS